MAAPDEVSPDDAAPDEAAPEDLHGAMRAAGLRMTRQRAAIARVLAEARDHPDATEVLARARVVEPTVSLATVYRTLAALAERGVVQRLELEGSPARFETSDAPHHDHIVDLDTGEVVEFVSDEIERLQREVARRLGYEVVSHRLELRCRRRRAPD